MTTTWTLSGQVEERWRRELLGAARQNDPTEQKQCRPPSHETVEWHLTQVVEAYLPSHAGLLEQRLLRTGWSKNPFAPTREVVPSLRRTAVGGGWTQLVTLVAEDKPNPPHAPLGRRLALPDGVAVAYLRLLSITSSLTLLSGTFVWNDVWGEALDRIAKRDYPTILPPGGALYGPFFHKQLEARIRRRAMRRHVSSWLTDQIPGAFAELSAELPAIDVITSAWARPFQEDPPLGILDYREALALGPRHSTAFSPALPGWTLALDDPSDRHVLTLAGRTVEVFDDRSLKLYGGVSRGGMASFLWLRIQDLACSWATLNLMSWLHSSLASTRDRAPEVGESPSAFARRISRDLVALRRGNDAATVCSDLLELPSRMGAPAHPFSARFRAAVPSWKPPDGAQDGVERLAARSRRRGSAPRAGAASVACYERPGLGPRREHPATAAALDSRGHRRSADTHSRDPSAYGRGLWSKPRRLANADPSGPVRLSPSRATSVQPRGRIAHLLAIDTGFALRSRAVGLSATSG